MACTEAGSRARSERQLDGGILPEAARLRERFGTGLRSFSSIGYREAWDLLDGRIGRAGYLAVNTQRNVDFARRQRTWFRRDVADLALDAAGPDPLARVLAAVEPAVGAASGQPDGTTGVPGLATPSGRGPAARG